MSLHDFLNIYLSNVLLNFFIRKLYKLQSAPLNNSQNMYCFFSKLAFMFGSISGMECPLFTIQSIPNGMKWKIKYCTNLINILL